MTIDTFSSIKSLKREAKKIAKSENIPLGKALDRLAVRLGFHAWSHMQSEMNQLPAPSSNRVIFFQITSISKMPTTPLDQPHSCMPAHQFISELVEAARSNRISELIQKYVQVEMFCLLNIEDFASKTASSTILKGIVTQRRNTKLVSYLSRDQLLADSRFSDDFKFMLS